VHRLRRHASGGRYAHRIRHLGVVVVVVDGTRIVEVISDTDLWRTEPRSAGRYDCSGVDDFRNRKCGACDDLAQAANLMLGRTIECLLVVENEKMLGLVTTTDLLNQLGREGVNCLISSLLRKEHSMDANELRELQNRGRFFWVAFRAPKLPKNGRQSKPLGQRGAAST